MHELSVAQSILEIVQANLPAGEGSSVESIKVKVGQLSGVVPDSLEFCFSALAADTPFQGASLQIEVIPFTLECRTCGEVFVNDIGFVICPHCGGSDSKMLGGMELQVVEIELCDRPMEVA
jgi:hydrogenase nickel incorporation protein HypA/HybF